SVACAPLRCARGTVRSSRRDLTAFAGWLGRAPSRATSEELERYVSVLRAEGLAATTIARRIAEIRSFFRHQVLIGAREDNPAAEVGLPRRARKLPRTLCPGEAERLHRRGSGASSTGPC